MSGAAETPGNRISISVRAAAPVYRNRKVVMGMFPMSAPTWSKDGASWRMPQEKLDPRRHPDSTTHPWMLERRKGDLVQRGTYESGLSSKLGAGYFVIVKEGNEAMAIPVEQWFTFKPNVRRDGVTLEQVEAEMARQRQGAIPAHLVPKSVEEMIANKNADELKKEGISVSHNMVQLFGDDDDDKAGRRRRGGGGGGGGGRGGAGAPRDDIDPDEMPEDIFAGENDEMRPERPDNAEDWEHDRQADDDDLDQGEGDEEKLEDDPGLRKKLGLAEDEEELDDQGKAIKLILKQEEEDEEDEDKEDGTKEEPVAAVPPKEEPEEEVKDEDEDMDEDQDLDDFAEEHEERLVGGKGGKRARTPPKSSRAQTPPPAGGAQRRTPPPSQPGTTAAGAKRRPSPDPETLEKASKRSKPEPAAAPARGTTPPPRPAPAAAPAGAPAQRKSPSPAPTAAAAAATDGPSGVPSNDEIIAAIRSGHNTTKAIVAHFKNRCAGNAAAEFKTRLLKLVRVADDGKGNKTLVLKEGGQ